MNESVVNEHMAERVGKMSLSQVVYILWRRMWVVALAFASTVSGAAAVYILVPPRYDATATASMDPGQTDPVSGQLIGGPSTVLLQGNMVALATSNQVALDVVRRLNLAGSRETVADYGTSTAAGNVPIDQWVATELLKHVDAKFGVVSNVLSITYKSPSPIQSALLANTFLTSFIDAAVREKVSAAEQTAQWFDPQIDKLRADLASARDKLTQFQRAANLVSPTTGDSENDQLLSATNEVSKAKSVLVTLENQLAAPPVTAAESNDAESIDLQMLTSLRSNIASVNAEISRLQGEVGSNNPKLTERLATRKSLLDQIDTQISEYHKRLSERIEGQKAKIAALEQARIYQLGKMIEVQAKRDQLTSLTREVDFRQDALDRAAKTAVQARLQSQLSFSNIAIIDKATPPLLPAFPKLIVVAIAGLGAGIALGLILALLVEALDRRVRAISDLEFVSSAPVLGALVRVRFGRRVRYLPYNVGGRIASAATMQILRRQNADVIGH